MPIFVAVIILGGLGIIFGVGLAYAARKLAVPTDPRLDKILKALPGVNCGACGKAGCSGFAEALIKGECTPEQCVVCQVEARAKVAGILGLEAKSRVRSVALLHCHGGSKRVKNKFEYIGISDCTAASLVQGGPKACVYGCIGFGTCARACPFSAISMNEEDLPVVNQDKCTACGKCVAACPKKLFELVAVSKTYAVRCKSLDFGKKVLEVCAVGCIGCGKCAKVCPTNTIKITDNLSIIDYRSCDNRGECFKVCPTKAIAKKESKHWITR